MEDAVHITSASIAATLEVAPPTTVTINTVA